MPVPVAKRTHLEQEMRQLVAQLRAARHRQAVDEILILEARLDEMLDAWIVLVGLPPADDARAA